MTKRDYEIIATGIAACVADERERHLQAAGNEAILHLQTNKAFKNVAMQLAAKFRLSHDAFNMDKFIAACGVNNDGD
jgi:hypothetical protein